MADLIALIKTYCSSMAARPTPPSLECIARCDDERGAYSVITVDWDGPKRIVGVTLLATVRAGRVTIHHDGTPGFADELIDHGVPEAQIALTFHLPKSKCAIVIGSLRSTHQKLPSDLRRTSCGLSDTLRERW